MHVKSGFPSIRSFAKESVIASSMRPALVVRRFWNTVNVSNVCRSSEPGTGKVREPLINRERHLPVMSRKKANPRAVRPMDRDRSAPVNHPCERRARYAAVPR